MNKKKSIVTMTVIITVIVVSVFVVNSYYLFCDYTKDDPVDLILNKIHNQLEKERLLDVGYYNLVDWSDGVFKITHFLQKNRLEMISDDKNIVLFEDVKGYIKNKDKLYVVSDEGIAVVSKGDVLKICIFDNSSENYTPFTTKNEHGLFYYNKYYEDDKIKRFHEIDEFSKNEERILECLMKKHNIKWK